MELLSDVKGNRAIVLMTDGTNARGTLDHSAFWNLLETKRVRIYAIGMGRLQWTFDPNLASGGNAYFGTLPWQPTVLP